MKSVLAALHPAASLVLAAALGLAARSIGDSARQPGARLEKYRGEFYYSVTVVPPWANAGKLIINLPEHFEYGPTGQGILRYNDEVKRLPWQVAPDGRTATLDAESPTAEGVRVQGSARVVNRNRVELMMRVTNHGRIPLPAVEGLYCFQYGRLRGFPPRGNDLSHIYTLIGGKVVSLRGIKTRIPTSNRKGGNVIGCLQDDNWFVARYGGHITQGVDAAMTAVTSLDGRRKVIVSWKPGKSILSNGNIPCLHGDPFYGTVEPGQSAEARGVLLFTESSLERAMASLRAEGWGAALKPASSTVMPGE